MARLNEMIRARRKELGLTLLQVAEKTGVKEATVQRWESGNIKTIKYDNIEALSHALNCTPQYLMGWENEKNPDAESSSGIIEDVLKRLTSLTPEELSQVDAFVQFLLASRSGETAPHKSARQ